MNDDTIQHNHPPRCCCSSLDIGTMRERLDHCPLCPAHGELAQLGNGECPSCHQLPGRPPTEYCQTPRAHIRSGNDFAVPVVRADGITEPPVDDWIDNGCRCPTANHHPRCPTQPHTYIQATDDDQVPLPDCCERCGQGVLAPLHIRQG